MILEISEVTKVYSKSKKNRGGSLTALDRVSFNVDAGEVVGFIGPNGAGKSTMIKCITGLAAQTSGVIKVDGKDTLKERVAAVANVGAIIENPDMYLEWSGEENLKYLARLQGLERPAGVSEREFVAQRVEDVLKLVGLFDRRKDKVAKYSLGMKQRLGIAQALLNKPKLLILDEPANGLDPQGIIDVREIVTHLAHDKGMAVLVSSHVLAEMQQLCDRFVIIRGGKIALQISAEELKGRSGGRIVFTVDDVVTAKDIIKEKFSLEATVVAEGKVEVASDLSGGEIARELILGGLNVSGIAEKSTSLEEMFLEITSAKEAK